MLLELLAQPDYRVINPLLCSLFRRKSPVTDTAIGGDGVFGVQARKLQVTRSGVAVSCHGRGRVTFSIPLTAYICVH